MILMLYLHFCFTIIISTKYYFYSFTCYYSVTLMFYYTISYRQESKIMDLETWFQKIAIFTEQNKV